MFVQLNACFPTGRLELDILVAVAYEDFNTALTGADPRVPGSI